MKKHLVKKVISITVLPGLQQSFKNVTVTFNLPETNFDVMSQIYIKGEMPTGNFFTRLNLSALLNFEVNPR